ncbi:MAG TPA: YceI family protein [Bacteroidota bacterium]
MKKITAISLGLLFSAPLLFAQTTTWNIDPVHSRVEISVRHMLIAEVTGRFTDFGGSLVHTKEDFTDSKIEVVIKAKSINTDNEQRDNHLSSPDFLDAENYSDITFKSTAVEKTGNNTYRISGDLTIRGVTNPVVLDANYFGQVKDPYGNVRAGFKATASIDRFDYGVRWNQLLETGGLIVGETVNITLNVEFIKQVKSGLE